MNRRIDWIDNARLETKHGTALKVPWHVMHERDVQCAKEEEVDREREPTQSVSSHKHTHTFTEPSKPITTNGLVDTRSRDDSFAQQKKTYLSKHNLISKYFVNDWNFFRPMPVYGRDMHLCTHVWGYLCAYASVNADVVVRLRYCHNSVCFFFWKWNMGEWVTKQSK